jgi:hypothetical protein
MNTEDHNKHIYRDENVKSEVNTVYRWTYNKL